MTKFQTPWTLQEAEIRRGILVQRFDEIQRAVIERNAAAQIVKLDKNERAELTAWQATQKAEMRTIQNELCFLREWRRRKARVDQARNPSLWNHKALFRLLDHLRTSGEHEFADMLEACRKTDAEA